jgi:predicted transposase/invertase (TIGR01784 family)
MRHAVFKGKATFPPILYYYSKKIIYLCRRQVAATLSVLEGAKQDGLAEGRAKGMAKGANAEKIETAKRLLTIGASHDLIMTATGLTEQEIASLCK